ncbi:unnamed protein product, partial [Tetraodon nigroviridis]
NFTALQLGTVVPPARQATFEYSFIPAEPMGGAAVRPGDQPQLRGQRWERVPGCRLQPDGDRHRERRRPGWRDVRSPAFPPPPIRPPPPLSVLAAVILILLLFFLLLSIFTYVFLSALGLLIHHRSSSQVSFIVIFEHI